MNDGVYDFYHQRFRQKFILMKNEPGGGIPAAQWWPEMDCTNSWWLGTVCKNGYKEGKTGLLAFGDGTTYMGHLLAVLATEFYCNEIEKKDNQITINEIGIVIEALKRLDGKAEEKFFLKADTNGFLLRDDVTFESGSKINHAIGCVISGAVCRTGINDGNMLSQDQSIALIFGSAFVLRFVPDHVLNPYSGNYINREIKDFIDFNVKYYSQRQWIINNPQGDPVPLGYSALGYSFAIAQAAKKLTGRNYQNLTSLFVGSSLWQTLSDLKYMPNNNLHNEVNLAMQLYLMSINGMNDREVFKSLCIDGHYEIFLLAETVLNHKQPDYDRKIFEDLLSKIPVKGTCYGSPGCENIAGWMSTNRWFHSDGRNGKDYQNGSEFNGLDVMLLYNLYKIVFVYSS